MMATLEALTLTCGSTTHQKAEPENKQLYNWREKSPEPPTAVGAPLANYQHRYTEFSSHSRDTVGHHYYSQNAAMSGVT